MQHKKFKTYDDLYRFVEENQLGVIEQDNYGQLVIYTDLKQEEGGNLRLTDTAIIYYKNKKRASKNKRMAGPAFNDSDDD